MPSTRPDYDLRTDALIDQLFDAWAAVERREKTEAQHDRLANLIRQAQMGVINSYRDLMGEIEMPYDEDPRHKAQKSRKRRPKPEIAPSNA